MNDVESVYETIEFCDAVDKKLSMTDSEIKEHCALIFKAIESRFYQIDKFVTENNLNPEETTLKAFDLYMDFMNKLETKLSQITQSS